MKYKFNYEKDGYKDCIIVEGDNFDYIKEYMDEQIKERDWDESCIWEERII